MTVDLTVDFFPTVDSRLQGVASAPHQLALSPPSAPLLVTLSSVRLFCDATEPKLHLRSDLMGWSHFWSLLVTSGHFWSLQGLASRVFYSDNGSTATEVTSGHFSLVTSGHFRGGRR
eukprot:102364-Prorocentrum_minimum.AAC.1